MKAGEANGKIMVLLDREKKGTKEGAQGGGG